VIKVQFKCTVDIPLSYFCLKYNPDSFIEHIKSLFHLPSPTTDGHSIWCDIIYQWNLRTISISSESLFLSNAMWKSNFNSALETNKTLSNGFLIF